MLLREIAETKISAAHLRKILDTIPTLASCNLPDGSNEFLNQRWHDYTGLSPQEARGRGWRVAIHPEDLQKVLDTFQALRASGEPGELEHRLRRHDGEYRWFLFRVEPLRDELRKIVRWYGTNTDIENLKRTEEKLRQDERELRRVTDAIPHTIVIQQPDGTPVYANQAVLDYGGFTLEEVVASDFRARLFHPEDLERLREERQAALSRGLPFEIEQRARRKDRQYRWFLIRYKGGFAGAAQPRLARFEAAAGRSLVLGVVAAPPPETEIDVLRGLPQGELERVGEIPTISVDVRVLVATNPVVG